MAKFSQLGSVSSGTMRNEDLIPAFLDMAEELTKGARGYGEHRKKLAAIRRRANKGDVYFESEEADYDLHECLFDMLNEFAPPYCSFGSHEGDGANYGFWFDNDSFEEAVRDGEVLKVNDAWDGKPFWDMSDTPQYVAHVNDHGNLTLYNMKGEVLLEMV